MYRTALIAATLALANVAAAQDKAIEGHANWARSTQTHTNAWGAGVQYGLTWGQSTDAARLGTSLAVDYQKQERGGPRQTGASIDVTVQPGGNSALTPYAGASLSENWLSGGGAPSGAKLGLQYLVGVQIKPEPQGPLAIHLQVRPGYVRTQEHAITFRLGVSSSL